MRLKRFTLLSIVSIFIFTALIAGCTPAQRPTVDPNRNTARDTIPDTNRDTLPNTDGVNPDTVPLRPNTIDEDRNNNRNNNTAVRDMEKKVANEVEKVPGVKNATVLINNNTAYIGIDLDEAIEDRQITVIKDRIVNKVKDMENRITMVYVSADVDVVGRLRGYAQDIREGKPISGIFEEIEDMFRRAVPRS
jgi:YhcN/YlaJ family sporulation lipoprotein